MEGAVTWVWVGTVAGTAMLSTGVTLALTKLLNGRRSRTNSVSNCSTPRGDCKTCGEIRSDIQKLECLPGKATRTNELLAQVVGKLDTLIQLTRK